MKGSRGASLSAQTLLAILAIIGLLLGLGLSAVEEDALLVLADVSHLVVLGLAFAAAGLPLPVHERLAGYVSASKLGALRWWAGLVAGRRCLEHRSGLAGERQEAHRRRHRLASRLVHRGAQGRGYRRASIRQRATRKRERQG